VIDKFAFLDVIRPLFSGGIKGSQVVAMDIILNEAIELGMDRVALAHRLAGAHFPNDIERAAVVFEQALEKAGCEAGRA
jgi:hypothetical protein